MFRVIVFLLFSLVLSSCINVSETKKRAVKKDSILFLEIKGIITSETSEEFMKYVRTYAGNSRIKAILLRLNTPGGTVGASQEINETVQEIRNFYKKPVIVSGGDVVASGGVYSSVSANKVFVNKGTLFGSVGILMQFQNLSELSRWAKVEIYTLKAGEFKDSGSPFREMTLRERQLFESTLDSTLEQFKLAIMKGRNLSEEAVDRIADGRIMTGEEALALGLVDGLGSLNMAIREAGKMAGLGSNPILFSPIEKSFFAKYLNSAKSNSSSFINKIISKVVTLNGISGQPLYILPSYLSPQ